MTRRNALVRAFAVAAIAVLPVWAASSDAQVDRARDGVPTFNRDVAPILHARCGSCHRPGQATPMSLLSFADARPWAQAIRRKVAAREMPPWLADPRFGRFSNNPTLTDAEIATILSWADGGAAEGAGSPPAPPRMAEGWSHPSGRPPDVILEMPNVLDIPPDGALPAIGVYSQLPPELAAADRFIEAVQLIPGNVPVTHHSSLSMRTFPAGVRLGQARLWQGGPLVDNVPVVPEPRALGQTAARPSSGAEVFSRGGTSHLVFFFPGNDGFARYPPGVGKRLRRGDHVEWSVHYTPSGRPERDRHRAGLWLPQAPPIHEAITLRVGDFHIVNGEDIVLPSGASTNPGHAAFVDVTESCNGSPCVRQRSMIPPIPPHARNWRITAITPFQDDVTLYSAFPHGHLRLQDMTYVLTYPDGREEVILSVPRYDFDWQLVYRFAEPLRVPSGSTIKVIGHFDNSAGNRRNPAPDRTVDWSEQSWDEMFNGFVDMSIDELDVRLESEPRGGSLDAAGRHETPLVVVAGCAAPLADGRWVLTEASEPASSPKLHLDEGAIAESRTLARGTRRFRLIGTAEFESAEELLRRGQRAAFTTAATANATGRLRAGRLVGVKALLVTAPDETRLNVLSTWPIADTCRR